MGCMDRGYPNFCFRGNQRTTSSTLSPAPFFSPLLSLLPRLTCRRSTSPSSLSASTSSPTSTSASASLAVVTPPRSTLSARPLPSLSSPITRSTSTSTPRTCSSRPSSSSTAPCLSPTTAAASPRSSVVPVPEPASRSLTDKGLARQNAKSCFISTVSGGGKTENSCLVDVVRHHTSPAVTRKGKTIVLASYCFCLCRVSLAGF